jgi:6-phosphogluconolactonase (cycloisomerase 2 family)
LSAAHPNPAQVLIDPTGQYLVVTEKGANLIDVYRIHDDGSLSGPTSFASVGAVPFGMAFSPTSSRRTLIVADALGGPNNTGAVTSYRLAGGKVRAISGPVPDTQIAPCWMVVTRDGRFAYTSNADSQSISGYRIQADGTISLLDATGVTGTTPADTFPIEEALSRNSRFLYVLDTRLLLTPPGPATLSGFRIHHDGRLTPVVDPASISLPLSAIGLAAD